MCTGGKTCCGKDNRCAQQEGNCVNDEGCMEGLKCGAPHHNCNKKSGDDWDDTDSCCYKHCTGGDSCCTEDNRCAEHEGDCDKDSDCMEGLKCAEPYNNCPRKRKDGEDWDSTDSCCYKPCTGGESCCTPDNPCNEQEGNCKKDSDCMNGLKCGYHNCLNNGGFEWDINDNCCYKPGRTKLYDPL